MITFKWFPRCFYLWTQTHTHTQKNFKTKFTSFTNVWLAGKKEYTETLWKAGFLITRHSYHFCVGSSSLVCCAFFLLACVAGQKEEEGGGRGKARKANRAVNPLFPMPSLPSLLSPFYARDIFLKKRNINYVCYLSLLRCGCVTSDSIRRTFSGVV